MKNIIAIINQVFEIEKKTAAAGTVNIGRQLERIRSEIEALGYAWHNPLHEKWDETRTDCEASITGTLKARMLITDVIKPIVHQTGTGGKTVVQKAVVIVS
ncbi:MAG: hypothetical protein JWP27_694 [Flaviaesturariibacter sp.]|nr:hypothetical protein [Flaviaesturariibacter sp.]